MFESAELGHAIDDETYRREAPKLRAALLDAQAEIRERAQFPVIVVIAGMEAAGKGDTLHLLHEWMDPRDIETHAAGRPDCVEQQMPEMWRFWRALPAAGRIGIFFHAWYRDPTVARVYGGAKKAEFERAIEELVRFERMLTDEGALVLKLWLHVSKKQQGKRLRQLSKDRATRWKVDAGDWRNHRHYAELRAVGEETIARTSTQHSPWVIIEGFDANYRNLTVARVLLEAMRARLAHSKEVRVHAAPLTPAVDNRALLRALDMKKKLSKKESEEEVALLQSRLNALSRKLPRAKHAVIAAFEGPDAAGKGGAIRRVVYALDARHYRVVPISAPTDEERAHPYLWRFWRHVPRAGDTALFDRSWYGRVLVERVEGLCSEADWMRAYSEINDFEAQLARARIVITKFWLQVTKEEQLARFEAREGERYKRYKLTRDDWRNRKKWDAYEQAACDMIDRTSTDAAPWTVVEADDKHWARVKVLRTLVARIEESL